MGSGEVVLFILDFDFFFLFYKFSFSLVGFSIIIIIYSLELFTSALADSFSLESVWQRVSNHA